MKTDVAYFIDNEPLNNITRFCLLMKLASRVSKANPLNTGAKTMDITDDEILNLLSALNTYGVQYLLVGGLAGVFHGHIRTTHDLDLWVKSSAQNRQNLVEALKQCDVAGSDHLKNTQFVFGFTTVKFGQNGFELDLGDDLKLFKQQDFDACYARAVTGTFDGIPFSVIGIHDLIAEKEAVGRPKDLGDAEELKKIELKNAQSNS